MPGLIKMLKGYYRGELALAVDDTVPHGEFRQVSDELADTLVAEKYAKRIDTKTAPVERATAAGGEQATSPAQKAK